MKNDARHLLNKKKLQNQSGNRPLAIQRGGPRGTVDARKILNIKRAQNVVPNRQITRGIHKNNKFNKTAKGLFTKAFSAGAKAHDKRIKVTNDGNILITAKSKEAQKAPQSSQRIPIIGGNMFAVGSRTQQPAHQWVPADIEMDNLEHIGIDDLLDMEALPAAAVASPNIPSQNRMMLSRMQPDGMSEMRNTMIADQIGSASTSSGLPKVYVTNLHTSVTKHDILELFGDVGTVKTIQMSQPGIAVIEYFDPEDATKAHSTYHNRLLDGHPMKCYLEGMIHPQRSSVSQRLGGRIQSISPIASTSTFVSNARPAPSFASTPRQAPSFASNQRPSTFVSNPRSRYNPRDVRFTVKLT